MKQYTVNYFINKFEAIPEDNWIVGNYNGTDDKHCALGFCGMHGGSNGYNPEANALFELLYVKRNTVVEINDGEDPKYQQPTPKQRVIAALYDIKKMQYPELSQTTVEELITQYPAYENRNSKTYLQR